MISVSVKLLGDGGKVKVSVCPFDDMDMEECSRDSEIEIACELFVKAISANYNNSKNDVMLQAFVNLLSPSD